MVVTWNSDRAAHVARHRVTIDQANEALADERAIAIEPDYASKSGNGIRVIGYSEGYGALITVIVARHEGRVYGATAFPSNARDRRYYEEK